MQLNLVKCDDDNIPSLPSLPPVPMTQDQLMKPQVNRLTETPIGFPPVPPPMMYQHPAYQMPPPAYPPYYYPPGYPHQYPGDMNLAALPQQNALQKSQPTDSEQNEVKSNSKLAKAATVAKKALGFLKMVCL